MHPILIKVGPFAVYSYGVMVAIGFAAAAFLVYRRSSKFGLDRNRMVNLLAILLLSGIFGARTLYIFLNLSFYQANPLEIIMLSNGGLVWYGGFAAALITLIFYLWVNKISFWQAADLIVPYVALAQGFGRIGCFLNGCCYGIAVKALTPFAVTFPFDETSRLPSQLISGALLFLIFIILRVWQDRRRFGGEIFLGYCMLYSFKRFIVEFLRSDSPRILFGLTISQILSIAVFIIAAALFLKKAGGWKKRLSVSK